jgi:transporter family protein
MQAGAADIQNRYHCSEPSDSMSYLPWALVALVGYTLVPVLLRVATTGPNAVPSDVAMLLTNGLLIGVVGTLVVATDQPVVSHLRGPNAGYILAAGVCLTVGILAYYRALARGPVSVVTPIFGMFLVTSSILGIAVLGEAPTPRKLAGIVLAVVAVALVSIE